MSAATSAALRARRLLALLHVLERDTRHSLDDIAAMLGAEPSEIAEDLDALACCGVAPYSPDSLVPIFVEEGTVTIFGDMPALQRSVRLSPAEARAVAAAMQTAGLDATDPLTRSLLEAAAPRQVDPAELERVVRAAAAPGSGPALAAVATGLHAHHCVEITYRSAGVDSDTHRVVEPLSLVAERGAWYTEAFCRHAGALRTFRIDRIRSARVTEERFEPRSLSVTGTSIDIDELPRAVVRLDPGEQFSERDWPGATVAETQDDGSLLVHVPYAGPSWIARQVLARLGGAEIVEPAELRAAVAELAGREIDAG